MNKQCFFVVLMVSLTASFVVQAAPPIALEPIVAIALEPKLAKMMEYGSSNEGTRPYLPYLPGIQEKTVVRVGCLSVSATVFLEFLKVQVSQKRHGMSRTPSPGCSSALLQERKGQSKSRPGLVKHFSDSCMVWLCQKAVAEIVRPFIFM